MFLHRLMFHEERDENGRQFIKVKMQYPVKQPMITTKASNRCPVKTKDTTTKGLHNMLIKRMLKTWTDQNRLLPQK